MFRRTTSIFKSRWMALVWALGIIVVAFEVAGPEAQASNTSENAQAPTDAMGDHVSNEDAKKLDTILNGL
jgi:hypothetical protein